GKVAARGQASFQPPLTARIDGLLKEFRVCRLSEGETETDPVCRERLRVPLLHKSTRKIRVFPTDSSGIIRPGVFVPKWSRMSLSRACRRQAGEGPGAWWEFGLFAR